MPKIVQIQRQASPSAETDIQLESVVIHDTTLGTLRVHDGSTAGGVRLGTKAEVDQAEADAITAAQAYTDSVIDTPDLVIVTTTDLDMTAVPATWQNHISVIAQPPANTQIVVTLPDYDDARFIDGYRLGIHHDGDASGSVLLKTPDDAPDTPIDDTAELLIATSEATVTVLMSTALNGYQIMQDSRPKTAAGLTFYATTTADPVIPGYTVGVTDTTDARYNSVAIDVADPVVPDTALDRATAILTGNLITDADVLGVVDGNIVTTVRIWLTGNAARTARTFLELYVRDAGGTETKISETADSSIITDVPETLNNVFPNVQYSPTAGDRLVVKSYIYKDSASGADPTVNRTFGGTPPTNALRAVVPQSLTAIQSTGGGGPSLGTNSVIRINDTNIKEDITVRDLVEAFTVDTGADTLNKGTANDYNEGDVVYLETDGTLPAPLAVLTPYYVKGITSATMQLAATFDGAALDITDAGTGNHTMYKAINGSSKGPITIEDTYTVTVAEGCVWGID